MTPRAEYRARMRPAAVRLRSLSAVPFTAVHVSEEYRKLSAEACQPPWMDSWDAINYVSGARGKLRVPTRAATTLASADERTLPGGARRCNHPTGRAP